MMENQGSGIFLKVLFGIGGITLLIFVWTQPMPESESMFSTLIGWAGLLPILVSSGIFIGKEVRNIIANNKEQTLQGR